MSDPFRDDRDAQLARADALALENEQLKRERDELKAKLDAAALDPTIRRGGDRGDLEYMRKRLERVAHGLGGELASGPEMQKSPPRLTYQLRGHGHGLPVTFDQRVIKIGRVASAHLRLEHPSVARMHAIIEIAGAADTACVIDLGSMVGTFINGQKVNKGKIKTGDVLRIGDVEMELTIVDITTPGAT